MHGLAFFVSLPPSCTYITQTVVNRFRMSFNDIIMCWWEQVTRDICLRRQVNECDTSVLTDSSMVNSSFYSKRKAMAVSQSLIQGDHFFWELFWPCELGMIRSGAVAEWKRRQEHTFHQGLGGPSHCLSLGGRKRYYSLGTLVGAWGSATCCCGLLRNWFHVLDPVCVCV